MAQGIAKNTGVVQKGIDKLTGMVPSIHVATEFDDPDALRYASTGISGNLEHVASPADRQITKTDILDAISQALNEGVALHLSDKGGEVMAGKLAKPLSYELEAAARRGR